ncbi:hydrogenase maturation nickel metallochaperone HypA [Kitasatospora aureofaciens]|uniref:hydrogenase maturation nickel metallochaperone HypA n=1 Tax=Kitasatospora aureofaciens TaxID=1894 RepID=UPI0007C57417|nr:hydrogenase maturation nickel metallochaperone HypA [Kitasatospora aureofaciens]
MHELSIALSVVEAVEEFAAGYPGERVEEVRLRVGALAGVEAEALDFSFTVVCEGTALAGARLAIEHVPAVVRCRPCEREFAVRPPLDLRCPACGGGSVECASGRELEIAAVVLGTAEGADEREVAGDVPSP